MLKKFTPLLLASAILITGCSVSTSTNSSNSTGTPAPTELASENTDGTKENDGDSSVGDTSKKTGVLDETLKSHTQIDAGLDLRTLSVLDPNGGSEQKAAFDHFVKVIDNGDTPKDGKIKEIVLSSPVEGNDPTEPVINIGLRILDNGRAEYTMIPLGGKHVVLDDIGYGFVAAPLGFVDAEALTAMTSTGGVSKTIKQLVTEDLSQSTDIHEELAPTPLELDGEKKVEVEVLRFDHSANPIELLHRIFLTVDGDKYMAQVTAEYTF